MSFPVQAERRKRQAGFTMIELLIAGVVLIVGLLAITTLFVTAIGNNGRSRVDSTATMVSQAVVEQISATLAGGGPGQVTDCQGNTFLLEYAAGGANLSGSGIDFTQSTGGIAATNTTPGYQMNFVVCNGGAELGTTATYDVRWNIQQVGTGTWLATVGARPVNMQPGRFTFSLPVTMRTYVGQHCFVGQTCIWQ